MNVYKERTGKKWGNVTLIENERTLLCVAPLAADVVVAVPLEDVLGVAPPDELPELIARLKLVLRIRNSRIKGIQHS